MVNETNQVTSASEWKGRRGSPIELPSGNIALLRRPGVEHFIRSGSIPNSLKNAIRSAMDKKPSDKLNQLMENEDDLVELFSLMDRILLEVVVEPKVEPIPFLDDGTKLPIDERDDSVIYVDEVDLEDKAFIFQYALGGTKDLERFRKEQASTLGNLQSEQGVVKPSEPAS